MSQIPVARMYKTTVILLAIVIVVTSYYLRVFPFSVIWAVIACSLIELALRKFHRRKWLEIPYTAIITGVVIGAVASNNAPILLIVLASAIAVLSKFYIKVKGSNVFNPATLGLLISLATFGAGDNWWIAAPIPIYGVLIAITPILVICAYETRRLYVGLSFLVASLAAIVLLHSSVLQSPTSLWTAIISLNFFLAFIMVSEPKTSPNKAHVQIVYGVGVAVMVSLLTFYKVPYALLVPILIGNIAYLAYRIKSGSR